MGKKLGVLALCAVMASIMAGPLAYAGDPSLVGWWWFDEGMGTLAADSSGNGNNGTLTGGATWDLGKFGKAVRFDGVDDYVSVPHKPTLCVSNEVTVMAWVNTPRWEMPGQGYQGIISKGNAPRSYSLYTTAAGILHFSVGPSGAYIGSTSTGTVPQNQWVHVCAMVKGGGHLYYINGVAAGTGGGGSVLPGTTDTATLVIGRTNEGAGRSWGGLIDDVRVYNRGMTPQEVQTIMKGQDLVSGRAVSPAPADRATDVPQDTALAWTAGTYAGTHDVYLGTAIADVNSASRTDKKSVLASQGQTDVTFQPAALLDFGKTYYWRVDEVNKTPDNTILKGNVWSFAVEPYGYPVTPVKATASSYQPGMGPDKTIDGSGLTADLHGTGATTMWISLGAAPNWIQYEFDKVYKLSDLLVWNSNQPVETYIGFGAKKVTIETSTDGTTWTPLANVPEFARATGLADYAANTTVDLGGVEAKFVKLTINSNWGGVAPQMGLAEVRFSYLPVQARAPQPAAAGTGVSVDASLDWRPGRGATSHNVFFGTDADAVTNGTSAAKTVTNHGFDPGPLNFGTSYYWRVDEVGAATYPGSVWSFITQPYRPIDDFESYTDKAGEEIFTIWIDGFADNYKSSGSTVGKDTAVNGTFGETTIIHGGKQSMPLAYDNTKTPFFSETERTFSPAEDWTGNGAAELVVYFRGSAPGFAETAAGSIVMNAIGTDIWNNGDQFRFAYKSLSGDGTMVARVDAIANSNVWAKGGVMIRQSIQPGSVHAFMPITPGGASAGYGASFQRRLTANGVSTNNDKAAPAVAAPYWVKIERKGNDFSGYISPDGKTWTQLGTPQTITMTNPVLIGLALCSHDAAIATGATFSSVSTTGNVTGTWQVAEIGAAQPTGNSLEGLYVTVKDSAGKTKTVQHPDAAATAYTSWQPWTIPLSEFTSAGVKMTAVKSLTIGVGNKAAPKAGGTGTVFIDDIGYGRSVR